MTCRGTFDPEETLNFTAALGACRGLSLAQSHVRSCLPWYSAGHATPAETLSSSKTPCLRTASKSGCVWLGYNTCACVSVRVGPHTHSWAWRGRRRLLDVLCHSLLCSLETRSLTEPGVHSLFAWLVANKSQPSSTLGLQVSAAKAGFLGEYRGSGDLYWGPYAKAIGPTEHLLSVTTWTFQCRLHGIGCFPHTTFIRQLIKISVKKFLNGFFWTRHILTRWEV